MAMWQRVKAWFESFAGAAAINPEFDQWWADHQEARAVAHYVEGMAVRSRSAGHWWPVRWAHD